MERELLRQQPRQKPEDARKHHPLAGVAVDEAVSSKYPQRLCLCVSAARRANSDERVLDPKDFTGRRQVAATKRLESATQDCCSINVHPTTSFT
jgi:hypothetical protein